MKEVPLSRQYSQINGKVIILTVDNLDKTIFDFLGDVKNSWEINHSLIVSTALTDPPDEKILIYVP